ncbi:histidine phosphatase family protein [Maribius pontilimi]|uniref:Histidine phosphatase family protein n=1 Tax=Palleronia pontilimi TaxID=1964209 RepID=A0A934MB81_9RHOB|nr:histidine phosphatase family protein [Palleronia pontilimi]MBJ3764462.1 histidine phosphatase family protein [Palleronia pontilimi]
MSLRLILTRHAKSDWGDPDLPDHDRTLNARGHRAADVIGRWMADQGIVPKCALLSTATRVAETWDGLAPHLDTPTVQRSAGLYHAAPETIMDEIAALECDDVIVVAHNPGLAALAQYLVVETPQRPEFYRFPTCATLVLDIPGESWLSLGPACAQVEHFVVPRDLTD